jgi:hypothetical protein
MKKNNLNSLITDLKALKEAESKAELYLSMESALKQIESQIEELERICAIFVACREENVLPVNAREGAEKEFNELNQDWNKVQKKEEWWRGGSDSWLKTRHLEEVIKEGILIQLRPLRTEVSTIQELLELKGEKETSKAFQEFCTEEQLLVQKSLDKDSIKKVTQLRKRGKQLLDKATAKGLDASFLEFVKQASSVDGIELASVTDQLFNQIDQNGLRSYVRLKLRTKSV